MAVSKHKWGTEMKA